LRQFVVALELLEDADQARGRDRRVDFDVQRLAVEVVNHVEIPKPATTRERVSHEIC
jgi:MoxR-like ATPase